MKNAFVCTSEFFKLIVNEARTFYLRQNLSILHFRYFSSGREKETKIRKKSISNKNIKTRELWYLSGSDSSFENSNTKL